MRERSGEELKASCFQHSLLERLSDLAGRLAGIRFMVVFPGNGGWCSVVPGGRLELPRFCRMIQATKEGAKHCRMCHILMAVAACSKGLAEQRCHAGASVLVAPVCEGNNGGLAVLGTCTFARGNGLDVWKEVRSRADKLGIDVGELKEAYKELPELGPEKLEVALAIMAAAGEAVEEIRAHHFTEAELGSLRGDRGNRTDVEAEVERELRRPALAPPDDGEGGAVVRESKGAALVRIVSNLVARKPSMPFSVAEIAAAARITPNHFSTLFHLHMGQSFTEFLTDRRMAAAKELLRDFTLNIGEVALAVGYSDPGYFTRRFKYKIGMTPREWRSAFYNK